jgi:hypothetical protein
MYGSPGGDDSFTRLTWRRRPGGDEWRPSTPNSRTPPSASPGRRRRRWRRSRSRRRRRRRLAEERLAANTPSPTLFLPQLVLANDGQSSCHGAAPEALRALPPAAAAQRLSPRSTSLADSRRRSARLRGPPVRRLTRTKLRGPSYEGQLEATRAPWLRPGFQAGAWLGQGKSARSGGAVPSAAPPCWFAGQDPL